MIIKVCQFQAQRDSGERLVQVFQPGQIAEAERFFSGMRKEAAPLLPDVRHYLENLKPHPRKIYVLVNALGAGEYWGSNINGDFFPEAALIHEGPDYGYKTFYNAHPYKHHVNKDPSKSFGDVMLAVWHDGMKRVELIIAIDRDRAQEHGATDVVDKLDKGIFADVSMGCKVPYDLCSICTDWKKYHRAQATYDPSIHRSVGQAVLMWHRRDPIRGVSVTRNDYCEHLREQLNRILEDGRRVCAINDYPRFFDISFVFIGADKTAKVMAKLAQVAYFDVVPSWRVAEMAGYQQPDTEKGFEKVASLSRSAPRIASELAEQLVRRGYVPRKKEKKAAVDNVVSKLREKSASHRKGATIIKDIVPSQFGGKAVPTHLPEPDLPNEVLDRLGGGPLESALSTASHMGMLLKPREFQRIVIIRMGRRPFADDLDRASAVFNPSSEMDSSLQFGAGDFSSKIMQMLLPFLGERSHFEPVIKRRIIRVTMRPKGEEPEAAPRFIEGDPLLDKISAAYNSYLDQMVKCAAEAAPVVNDNPELWSEVYDTTMGEWFTKTADLNAKTLLGALGATYLVSAYGKHKERQAMYGRGTPPGVVLQFLADHPHLSAILVGLGAAHLSGSDLPKKLVDLGKNVVKQGVEVATKV